MANLSNFRLAFIDAQNKAAFFNAGKTIISEFCQLRMEEQMENQQTEDKLVFYLAKNQMVFFWRLNGVDQEVILHKEGRNFYEKNSEDFIKNFIKSFRITDKITIYDTEIVNKVVKLITEIFTGRNWEEMPMAA